MTSFPEKFPDIFMDSGSVFDALSNEHIKKKSKNFAQKSLLKFVFMLVVLDQFPKRLGAVPSELPKCSGKGEFSRPSWPH